MTPDASTVTTQHNWKHLSIPNCAAANRGCLLCPVGAQHSRCCLFKQSGTACLQAISWACLKHRLTWVIMVSVLYRDIWSTSASKLVTFQWWKRKETPAVHFLTLPTSCCLGKKSNLAPDSLTNTGRWYSKFLLEKSKQTRTWDHSGHYIPSSLKQTINYLSHVQMATKTTTTCWPQKTLQKREAVICSNYAFVIAWKLPQEQMALHWPIQKLLLCSSFLTLPKQLHSSYGLGQP